ncbi:MAG TPA: HlyD family efflux transporter periplasmic adaptor subunit [Kofleriaceae bacterium]|nr:HlyD family efflux transporter periplasmic adaptor subunit [Kofleriaceae bacterium]
MTKLRYLVLAVLLAGIAWLWHACAANPVRAALPPPPRMVIAPGRVEPVRDPVALAFEVPGRIAEILVDEGDAVRAGQPVARLDDRLARVQLAAAEAGLAQAQARHRLAVHGPRSEDVAAARADADAAAVEARQRSTEFARSERLGRSGALATASIDADASLAQVAAARSTAVTSRYRALAAGTRVEQIEEAAAAVALAQAGLDSSRVALEQTVLRAPSDGVILRRTAEAGALVTVAPPVPVVAIADLGQLELRVEIDEADIAAVEVGQTAYATTEAYAARRFPVVVSRVMRELGRKTLRDDDPRARVDTRVLEVIARFARAPGSALPLGLRMQLHLGPARTPSP